MCQNNENPDLCYDKLKETLSKMFLTLLIVNIVFFSIIIFGGIYVWKRLQANVFFTYNMTRQTTEQLTNSEINWDSGLHKIIIVKKEKTRR